VSTEQTVLKLHTHQSLAIKCLQRGSPYRTVVYLGAIRSGKTLTLVRWMLDRGKWDTAQVHGLFANTGPQLQNAILQEVLPWLELAGVEWWWNKRPPAAWVERWRRLGIKVPPRQPKYTNILILSTGLHIYCGSMSNKSYRQIKGMKFGSLTIEEFTAGATEEGVRYLFERVNCGLGPARCAELHHHVKLLNGNIPDEDDHWIYAWLARREKQAATAARLAPTENMDEYPCLLRGIGDTIYIPSRTVDNVDNLPADFIDDMETTVDEETAQRVLRGVVTRRRIGRAYNGYDRKNLYPINYDPKRTLYLFLDYNNNPTVAGLAHPLRAGEFPSEFLVAGVEYEGVFGEFFHLGGMDAHQLALSLARGEKSSNGWWPENFGGLAVHQAPIIGFGDAKGGAKKSMTGFTPWSIVNEVLRDACRDPVTGRSWWSTRVPTENPLQQIRIRSLNARFCNARGQRLLFIHPNLHELQTDLETVQTGPDGTIVKPGGPRPGSKFWHRTHLSDGLGYMEYALHPMGKDLDPEAERPAGNLPPRRPRTPSFL